MLDGISRIMIVGGSGTGKTTLSENLGMILNYPVYHIDTFNHLENWKVRDKEERDKIILEKASEDKWIIDGTYRTTLKQRIERADLVIYLDYPTHEAMKGAIARFIKHKGKEKPEIPGCKEKMDSNFFFWVLNWRKNKREEIVKIFDEYANNKMLIFKHRRDLNKWFEKEFNKKIEQLDWEKKLV